MIETTVKTNAICHDANTKQDKHCACIEQFLSVSLFALGKELNRIAKSIYQYPDGLKGIDGKEGINDVFALIERSNVGILNNAILRSFPDDDMLQEFTVYQMANESEKHLGRADFLVAHKCEHGDKINLLFEAKAGIALWKDYKAEDTKDWYEAIHKQAHDYYIAEKKFYTGDTFTIAISFDWVRDKNLLLEELKYDSYKDDKVTDFYFIYHTDEAGLMVYGNVKPVEK